MTERNPFAEMQHKDHANMLAQAFVVARDFDQVFAICRYERWASQGCDDIAGYLGGKHFCHWDIHGNDWESAPAKFEEIQGMAHVYLQSQESEEP